MRISTPQQWLTLHFAPQVDGRFMVALEAAQLSPHELLSLSKAELIQLGLSHKTVAALLNPNEATISQQLAWAEHPKHHIICWDDPRYPALLKEITDPPLVLFVNGNPTVINSAQLAIVGSRRPTPMALETAHQFAHSLSQAGLIITSGLAVGIDGAAHRGALAADCPTVAVMASGLDQTYPYTHRSLAAKIAETGALVSEQPLQTPPQRHLFPIRNRIVTGLSLGTLVIEAALQSGSLISARLAMEQNRFVGAVPGSIYHPTVAGCHQLIQSGAALVTSSDDIAIELGMQQLQPAPEKISKTVGKRPTIPSNCSKNSLNKLDVDHQMLLECVAFEATPMDLICARASKELPLISQMLLTLECHGLVKPIMGGYARVKK